MMPSLRFLSHGNSSASRPGPEGAPATEDRKRRASKYRNGAFKVSHADQPTREDRALRRLGMRRSELNTAVHLQGADGIAEVGRGSLEPGGQLVLTLKKGQQGATKSDVAEIAGRLQRIENLLSAPRQPPSPARPVPLQASPPAAG